jgi:hypothetical protein
MWARATKYTLAGHELEIHVLKETPKVWVMTAIFRPEIRIRQVQSGNRTPYYYTKLLGLTLNGTVSSSIGCSCLTSIT